jgi:hypothetical protein
MIGGDAYGNPSHGLIFGRPDWWQCALKRSYQIDWSVREAFVVLYGQYWREGLTIRAHGLPLTDQEVRAVQLHWRVRFHRSQR